MYAFLSAVSAFVSDRFDKKDRGATAVEYGLLVGLISIAIVGTLLLLGPQLDGLFQQVLAALP